MIVQEDLDYLRELVERRAAIVLDAAKAYLFEMRLQPVAQQMGHADLLSLVAELKRTPLGERHDRVVEAMTTNETSFFRDRHPFDTLKETIIKDRMLVRAKARQLRIWCAASSTGQEPYSIAMLLREHFPELRSWDVSILATDLSQDVLRRAQDGTFTQIEVNRGLPAQLLVRHFRKEGVLWKISDDIRSLVQFRRMNLAEPWPCLPAFDMVFLRNVMIYFDPKTRHSILDRVGRLLLPDAPLFLGTAETTFGLHDGYERRTVGKSALYHWRG